MNSHPQPLTVYFAGELFSLKHLAGNASLAEALYKVSGGRYVSILPQNLEQRETTPHSIRDQDLRCLLACDVGVFNYDGTELDSGTVVEFMFAKFADIPSVLLRTDFRRAGDQDGDPWNLMTSFFPRTRVITADCVSLYQQGFQGVARDNAAALLEGRTSSAASDHLIQAVAARVSGALDHVVAQPPVLTPDKREQIYEWLAIMPGYQGGPLLEEMKRNLDRKISRQLL